MTERSKLIKKLDRIFSKYIRKRDSNINGIISCISCGKFIYLENSDCGHYYNRSIMSLRYDEKNCNAQCRHCNRFLEGNIQGYRDGLIKKYGHNVLEYLEIRKSNISKLGVFELNMLIDYYEKKVREL